MLEQLGRCWRIAATGFFFAAFGVGGLVIRVLVYPALRLLVRHRPRQALAAKWLIHQSFRAFVGVIALVGVISYEVRGREKLQRHGLLVLANHPSLIDVVLLISFMRRADCVIKGALGRNLFTRGPIRAAGFICNDSGGALVQDGIASIRSGNNLVIFPEGTRTSGAGEVALQRGAAHIAVRGNIDITPVCIRCSPPLLCKGSKWYHVPLRRAHFVIEVRDDIPVGQFRSNGASEAIAARRLTTFLTHYFFPETHRADA